MAIPGEWEALWERRDTRERADAPDDESVLAEPPRSKHPLAHNGPWLGMIVIVVLFLYTTMRSLVAIFSGSAVAGPFHLSVCSSTTVGTRLGSDLIGAFLQREGAQAVHITSDGPLTHVSARLPGRLFDTTVDMRSNDSAFAFGSLASGGCNVAIIGREINPIDQSLFKKAPTANLIALDGAVLVVNPSNPLRSISEDNMRSIFAGTTQNWARVGGRSGKIATYLPPEHSDEFSVFVEHVMHGQLPAAKVRHSDNVAQTVAAPGNQNAVGLTTFHASDPAKILLPRSPSGSAIPASTLTIGRRTYPLVMPIYAYRDEATMTPAAYKFISFLDSEEGQNIVVADGFVSPFAF